MAYRSYLIASLLIGLMVGLIQPVLAEVDIGGSARLRYEDKINFNLADAEQDYFLTQLRLHLDWKASTNNHVYVQLQDARVIGESREDIPSINDKARNQPFADKLDIHQLYYVRKWGGGEIKLGRQKFNLGDMRLVASLEWVNTARVHDGVRVTFGDDKGRKIDTFASRMVSVDPDGLNDQATSNNRYFDSEFHGVFVADKSIISNSELQYWYFLRDNDDFDDSIHTFGSRFLTKIRKWSFDVQGAAQTGQFNGLDHNAYMVHMGADINVFGGNLGFGYNHASGDSDNSDGDHATFDNLYPLNHAYYGFMDLFSLQNIHNAEAVFKMGLGSKAKLRFAYQGFWLADTNDAWYNAGLAGNGSRLTSALAVKDAGNDVDPYVGSEIDITVKYPLTKKWILMGGYSHFFSGSYTSETGQSNDADFLFIMTKMSF
ncbi:MAG: hypothetical protein ACI93R_003210 [Flavobacteriales bacterium]|jgi:hypothetical protein